jgi:gliding motility-associated-like protein
MLKHAAINKIVKRYFTLVVFLIFISGITQKSFAQNYWIKSAGGLGMDEILDMATDAAGNIYAVGYFSGVCSLQVNPNFVLTSNGGDDILIAKFSPGGNLIWAKKAGGTSADKAYAIAVTPNGECYVTGFFNNTAHFDNITVNAVNNSQDIFVAKYNANGQISWVKTGGGNGIDISNGIAVDNNGNCVITGQVINSGNFSGYTFSTQLHPVTNQATYDIFIARYDSSGNIQWLKNGLGKYTDRGMCVAIDNNSNAYVGLQFSDTLVFNATYHNNIFNAIGLLKLDSSGNELWFKKAGGATMQVAYNIHVSPFNELLLTGDFKGNLTFFNSPNNFTLNTSNNNSIFIAKYNLSGNLMWAKSNSSSNKVTSRSIVCDPLNNIYISGHFECKMDDFSNIYGQGTFNSVGYNDVYTAKYTSAGDFEWARHFGGRKQDYGYALVVNTINRPIIGGSFWQQFNIPVSNSIINNGINSDAFSINCNDQNYSKYNYLLSNGAADIFLMDALDLSRLPYNFYALQTVSCNPPQINGCIANTSAVGYIGNNTTNCDGGIDFICANDSINVCDSTLLYVATHTSLRNGCGGVGPLYKYYWSTGDSLKRAIKVTQPGIYSVYTVSEDGCYSFEDTIEVTISNTPHITVSDDIPVRTHSHTDYTIAICANDTITLSGSNFANSTYTWNGTGLPQGGINDSIIQVYQSGSYTFNTVTPEGCFNHKTIDLIIDTTPPSLVPVQPYLQFSHPTLINDSIVLCYGEEFLIYAIDSISGQCVPFINQVNISVNSGVYSTSSNTLCPMSYSPQNTGWYQFNMIIQQQISNLCGMDTASYFVSDSIYVTVLSIPNAQVNLSGNPLLCPGDTNTIQATGTGNYTWNGPGIIQIIGDSIAYIVSDGNYSVSTYVVDSITGCSNTASATFNVTEKKAVLSSNSSNNLICPNDSVQIIAPPGISFDWFGPYGYITTTTVNYLFVNAPGFYHAVMIDNSGCELVSDMIEIKQYATPDLIVSPNYHVCPGEIVTLEVTSSSGSIISWNSPLTGNTAIQYIAQPGNYSCSILSCGITTQLSASITHSQPLASIIPSGIIDICNGDSVILTANPGMINYEWIPGEQASPSIVVTSAGNYQVKTTNADGCDTISALVQINVNTYPAPIVNDTTVCYGNSVTLTAQSNGNIQWYGNANGTNIIGNNSQITLGPVYNDTIVYVAAYDTCFSNIIPVRIYIDTLSLSPPINGNSLTCLGGYINLSTPYYSNAQYYWNGPNGFAAFTDSINILNVSYQDSGIYNLYIVANGCTSNVSSITVSVLSALPQPTISGNTSLCEGDTFSLSSNTNYTNVNYYWNGPNGMSFNTQNIQLLNIQTYQSGYYYSYYTSGGCTSSVDSVWVNVYSLPPTPFISANSPLCAGDTLSLSSNYIAGATYHWSGPQSFSSNLQNPQINNVTTSNSGNYNLYVSLNGCNSLTATTSVTVYSKPTLQITGNTAVCEGNNLNLNASSNNGNINWYFNNQLINAGNNLNITQTTLNNSGYYIVTASNSFCTAIDSVQVNVIPIPVVNITANNSPICNGDSLIITADTLNNAIYNWYLNGNPISNIQHIIIPNADSTHTGIYTLQVNVNGCYSDTVNTQVVILPSSGSLFAYQEINVCIGDSILFPINCQGNVSYQWTGPNGFSSNQCNPFTGVQFNNSHSGVYYLSATLGTCSNNGDSIKIIVNNYPLVNLGNDTTICEGDAITLNGGIFQYYYWNTLDSTQSITVSDSGMYILNVTDNFYCWSADTIFISIEDCSLQAIANVFTPNGDGINDYFKISGKDILQIDVEIFDRWGNKIYDWNTPDGYWDGTNKNSKKEVPSGVYYYTAIIKTMKNKTIQEKGFIQLLR